MLIKFFARGQGSGSGPVEYCTRADIEGREHCPPVVLRGDTDLTTDLIDSIDRDWRYTSGVISFAREDAPTEAQQEQVMDKFEQVAFAGLEPDQFNILWVRHQHTDSERVELHFVTPRMELTTGKALNIAPPGWEKLYGNLVDVLNGENSWARPDDPERARMLQVGSQEATERLQSKEAINQYLIEQIETGAIYDRSSLIVSLEDAGFEINRQGKDYVTAMDTETGEKFRLKGTIYEQDWTVSKQLERTTEREAGAGQEADRRTNLERAQEARRELSERIEGRIRHHQERYPRAEQDHSADLGRDAALAALDSSGVHRDCTDSLSYALGGDNMGAVGVERDQGGYGYGTPDPFAAPKPDWANPYHQQRERNVSDTSEKRRERVDVRREQNPVHQTPSTRSEQEIDEDGKAFPIRARIIAFRQRVEDWYRQGNYRFKESLAELRGERVKQHNEAIERYREGTSATERTHEQLEKRYFNSCGDLDGQFEKLGAANAVLRAASAEFGEVAKQIDQVIEHERAREQEKLRHSRDDDYGISL